MAPKSLPAPPEPPEIPTRFLWMENIALRGLISETNVFNLTNQE
jgi:hypothetical protein